MQISTDATLCPRPSAYIRSLEDPLHIPIRQIAGDIERVTAENTEGSGCRQVWLRTLWVGMT